MVKFLSSKRGITSREKKLNQNFMLICISTWYVPHNYIALQNSVERLQRSCADQTNRTDGFSFWSNFQVKKGRYSEKKMNQISCEYAHLHIMSFITTKFYDIMLSGFRGGALTRKTGLPDWLNDSCTVQKHYTLRNSLRGV